MDDATFARRIRSEIDTWRREGVIAPELAATLSERYAELDGGARRSLAGGLIAMLGAVLLGIGVIAFFAGNWEEIPGWAKLALVVASFLSAYAAGYRMRYHGTTYRGTGDALLFLGTPLFGAALFMIANGYHIPVESPLLVTLWAIGVFPMAWVLGSRTQWALALLALGLAVVMEAVNWASIRPATVISAVLLYGVLATAIGFLMMSTSSRAPLGETSRNLGLLIVFWSLVPLGFKEVQSFEDYGFAFSLDPGFTVRFAVLAVAATAVQGVAWWRSQRTAIDHWAAGIQAALVGCAALSIGTAVSAVPAAILANVCTFGLVLALIGYAYTTRTAYLLNTAVLFFSIQTGCRYIDLFYETLPPEVFFLTLGALLLVGGMLVERGRRRMIRSWSTPTEVAG